MVCKLNNNFFIKNEHSFYFAHPLYFDKCVKTGYNVFITDLHNKYDKNYLLNKACRTFVTYNISYKLFRKSLEFKMKKLRILAILTCVMVICNFGAVFAELTPQQIVDQFNSLNGPNGWSFHFGLVAESYFAAADPTIRPDLSAYHSYALSTTITSGVYQPCFSTFCVEPNSPSVLSGKAKLSFTDGNSTRVTNGNNAVSVGTAFLYQQFATASFSSSLFEYTNQTQRAEDYFLLRDTLQALMSPQDILDWTSNKFYDYLLGINGSAEYWTDIYNPGERYTEIGDYAIFVMNITKSDGTGECQDFLYIAKADYSMTHPDVPEPTTILLWTMGVGAFGLGYRHRKSTKIALT